MITPVDELIVATLGFPLVHVPPVTVELNVVVVPAQTAVVPLKTPALGAVLTLTVRVLIASEHPAPETV